MFKSNNSLFLAIILLIFTAQAIATTVVSCPMPMRAEIGSGISTDTMDHSAHMSGNMSESHELGLDHQMSDMDCCSDSTDCSMNGCGIFVIMIDESISLSSLSYQARYPNLFLALNNSISSPYKPPIFS